MATIYKEISIAAPAEKVWAALRDFGAVHTKLVPGFLTDCKVEHNSGGDIRIVTFFNGSVAREQLVGIDADAKRLAYTVVGGQAVHHNASAQVIETDAAQCRFVWITDVLPQEFAAYIDTMMERGAVVIKNTLER